jgi:hypothetical protein
MLIAAVDCFSFEPLSAMFQFNLTHHLWSRANNLSDISCLQFILKYTTVPRIQHDSLQALSSLVENISQTFQNFHKAIDTNRFQAIRNSEQVFRHRQELMRAIPHEPVTHLPTLHRNSVCNSSAAPNSPRSPSARS